MTKLQWLDILKKIFFILYNFTQRSI